MWTPRRLMLLVAGIGVFTGTYLIYARFLGYLDGFPLLPDEFTFENRLTDSAPLPQPTERILPVDRKLQQAFGPDCVETGYTIKLDVQAKNVCLAADKYIIEEDGRVQLSPFSVAVFGKAKDPQTGMPEINTVHCDQAYLEFEQPVRLPSDMARYRIVAAELVSVPEPDPHDRRSGRIHLRNNRRSLDVNDDFALETVGPMYYREEKPNPRRRVERPDIWTRAVVEMWDFKCQPRPTTVRATGMNVYLLLDESKPPLAKNGVAVNPTKVKPGTITGVRKVELCSNVRMDLWVDQKGFLANGKDAPPASEPVPVLAKEPSEKVRIEIKTLGPFRYDVPSDRARFDIIPQANSSLPNHVEVKRYVRDGVNDQLVCDVLELQFRRKEANAPKPLDPSGEQQGMEIVEAHAWGKAVALSSDSEELAAIGNDLVYNADAHQTVMKGVPYMVAIRDGSEIQTPELILLGIEAKNDRAPQNQQARARGRGKILMLDKQTGKQSLEAHWRDEAIFAKEQVKDRLVDVLTLNGEAAFRDTDRGQHLQADQLKLWLAPPETNDARTAVGPAPGKRSESRDQSSRKPYKLLAVGHVAARSPDLLIHDTDQLVVWFRDPDPPAKAPSPHNAAEPSTTRPTADADVEGRQRPIVAAPGGRPLPTNNQSSKKPIEVSAHAVETHAIRWGNRYELDKVACEGRVRVHQDHPDPDPGRPPEADIDIVGETLRLTHYGQGNILIVSGTTREPAEVHMPKLSLVGPDIQINQLDNTAQVNGLGSLKMPTSTDLNGNLLPKPSVLTVLWSRRMDFTGSHAVFEGKVQAQQDNAHVLCENMQVDLDRVVSLNPSEKNKTKGEQPAKVAKVICHTDGQPNAQPVCVTDVVRENGKLIRYQRIVAAELALDNETGRIDAPAATQPGVVTLLQLGNKGEAGISAGPQLSTGSTSMNSAGDKEMKLTRVKYSGKMFADQRTRVATFYDNVEVLHGPGENPDADINVDKLPPGGLHLTCQVLKVRSIVVEPARIENSRRTPERTSQQMDAIGKAKVQAQEFHGNADTIKFDEAKDLVIFQGSEGSPAVLYRYKGPGRDPDKIMGVKIHYWRKTNAFDVNGVTGLSGTP